MKVSQTLVKITSTSSEDLQQNTSQTFQAITLPLEIWLNATNKTFFFFFFKNTKGTFGNCFFLLFFVFKNNFLFLRLKNLFGNLKWTENKNCSQNSICERNWKHVNVCFQFIVFKSQWKYVFDLINLSHLMS